MPLANRKTLFFCSLGGAGVGCGLEPPILNKNEYILTKTWIERFGSAAVMLEEPVFNPLRGACSPQKPVGGLPAGSGPATAPPLPEAWKCGQAPALPGSCSQTAARAHSHSELSAETFRERPGPCSGLKLPGPDKSTDPAAGGALLPGGKDTR